MPLTAQTVYYWLVPVNITGVPGAKSTSQSIEVLGPDGTTDVDVPGIIADPPTFPALYTYGVFTLDGFAVQVDASGNTNISGAQQILCVLLYIDELETDLWASIDANIGTPGTAGNTGADPLNTFACTLNPATSQTFTVGDFVLFNDEEADPNNGGRRCYEAVQITGISAGNYSFQRAYPGVAAGSATFGTFLCPHRAGVKFYKLKIQQFPFGGQQGGFQTSLPTRLDMAIPTACVVAAVVSVANYYGYGPFTVFPLSQHSDPYMPGNRTCDGNAYTFQLPGVVPVQDDVPVPVKTQAAAALRTIYAYVQTAPTDASMEIIVKYSTDGGATWTALEQCSIVSGDQNSYPAANPPSARRLPYGPIFTADPGAPTSSILTSGAITASGSPQVVAITLSGGASGIYALRVGEFAFLEKSTGNEEYCLVSAVNSTTPSITIIATKNHASGVQVTPTIWPVPVLKQDYDLGYDVKQVGSTISGSDLTVVVQT